MVGTPAAHRTPRRHCLTCGRFICDQGPILCPDCIVKYKIGSDLLHRLEAHWIVVDQYEIDWKYDGNEATKVTGEIDDYHWEAVFCFQNQWSVTTPNQPSPGGELLGLVRELLDTMTPSFIDRVMGPRRKIKRLVLFAAGAVIVAASTVYLAKRRKR